MAFIGDDFVRSSAQANGLVMHSYQTVDSLADTKAANYFDPASSTSGGYGLKDGDFILVSAVDGVSFLKMDVDSSGAATTTAANDFA